MEHPNSKGANNFVVGMFVFVALLVSDIVRGLARVMTGYNKIIEPKLG